MDTRLTVSETMERDPLVEPGTTRVMEAARAMRDRGTGCLLVYNDRNLEGIVTERDILHKVVAEGLDPGNIQLRDIMTRDVLTVEPEDTVVDALRLMKARDIRRLPVVREGRLIGLVTEHIVSRVAPELIEIVEEFGRIVNHNGHTKTDDGTAAPIGYRELRTEGTFPGACENCGNMDTDLHEANGTALCSECLEAEVGATRSI